MFSANEMINLASMCLLAIIAMMMYKISMKLKEYSELMDPLIRCVSSIMSMVEQRIDDEMMETITRCASILISQCKSFLFAELARRFHSGASIVPAPQAPTPAPSAGAGAAGTVGSSGRSDVMGGLLHVLSRASQSPAAAEAISNIVNSSFGRSIIESAHTKQGADLMLQLASIFS